METVKKFSYEVRGTKLDLIMALIFSQTESPYVLIKAIENNIDIGSVKFIIGFKKYLIILDPLNSDPIFEPYFELYKKKKYAERLLESRDSKTILIDEESKFL